MQYGIPSICSPGWTRCLSLQANDAGLEAELVAGESGSDEDEDAEAKLTRLRKAAGTQQPAGTSEHKTLPPVREKRRRIGRTAELEPADTRLGNELQEGIASASRGPLEIEISNNDRPAYEIATEPAQQNNEQDLEPLPGDITAGDGVLAKTAAGQRALRSRAHILQPPLSNGQTVTLPKINAGKTVRAVQVQAGKSAPEPAFIPSETFSGERPGFAFGSGRQGLGYYKGANLQPERKHRRTSPTSPGRPDQGLLDDAVHDLALEAAYEDDEGDQDKDQGNTLHQVILH